MKLELFLWQWGEEFDGCFGFYFGEGVYFVFEEVEGFLVGVADDGGVSELPVLIEINGFLDFVF